MTFFTLRNLVILALVQVGLIVFSVLGAGLAWKWVSSFQIPSSPRERTLDAYSEYGGLLLILPLVWIIIAVDAFRRPDTEEHDQFRAFAMLLGIGMTLVLLWVSWTYSFGVIFKTLGLW
jgi:hypothetical protein